MLGYRFSNYTPPPDKAKSDFEKLLKIFMQLVLITVRKRFRSASMAYGSGPAIWPHKSTSMESAILSRI